MTDERRRPLVAVADLHGHRTLFDRLIERLDRRWGDDYDLVLLGDYVDNGPEIPALLDRLVELEVTRGERFSAILGNHDLACLRSVGWEDGPPDESWFARWSTYWNHGLGTAEAYGAHSAAALRERMPPAHRAFLQERPWFIERDGHVFVHAGLERGPIAPQLDALRERPLLPAHHTPQPLRSKDLAVVSDLSWDRVVVSGHTWKPLTRLDGGMLPGLDRGAAPHLVTARRVALSAGVDRDGELWSVELPARRFASVVR